MKNRKKFFTESMLYEQIVSIIRDRKSRIILPDIEITPFARLSSVLDPVSMQGLLQKIESLFKIKIENEEVLQFFSVSGLPGANIGPEDKQGDYYRIKNLMGLTRLILCKI